MLFLSLLTVVVFSTDHSDVVIINRRGIAGWATDLTIASRAYFEIWGLTFQLLVILKVALGVLLPVWKGLILMLIIVPLLPQMLLGVIVSVNRFLIALAGASWLNYSCYLLLCLALGWERPIVSASDLADVKVNNLFWAVVARLRLTLQLSSRVIDLWFGASMLGKLVLLLLQTCQGEVRPSSLLLRLQLWRQRNSVFLSLCITLLHVIFLHQFSCDA